jgi:2-methylcitrate dehydratase PrpD
MDSQHDPMTRRALIHGGVLAAAASFVLPAFDAPELHATGTSTSASTRREPATAVMTTLASYMKDAQTRALPAEAAEHTKLHVLDTLAAMVSGAALAPGEAALRYITSFGTGAKATVVRAKGPASAIDAALANAMMAHADETDDSHAPSQSHPGCSVVPAALAAGEQFGIDGAHFLRAVALGYDIGTRMNMTLGAHGFEVGNHQSSHAFGGIWGSAAAAGCAASLSLRQLPWLMAYTADQSSGTTVWQRDTDHIQKAFAFAGVGARDGVAAALMVRAGWTGVDDVFTGQYNFFNAYAPGADPAKLVDGLGERYEVVRTNIKKWSVGSPIQAPLDALVNMRAKRPFAASDVKSVVVRVATSEGNLVDDREMPDISMQHMIAVMLIDKTASFASAHDKARMRSAPVLAERAKVTMIRDEALERLLPSRVAVVEVTLNDGMILTERVDAVRGTAQNPMSRGEDVAKARDLTAPVLGARAAAELIDRVMSMEKAGSLRGLRPLLRRA